MKGAAELEEAFRSVSDALAQPASPRWKIHELRSFLRMLEAGDSGAEVYLLELAEVIHSEFVRLDSGGLAPFVLEETAGLLGELIAKSSVLGEEPLLESARQVLLTAAATRMASIGDLDGMWRCLYPGSSTPSWWREVAQLPDGDPMDRFERLLVASRRAGETVSVRLEPIERTASGALDAEPHSATTAVVEAGFGPSARQHGVGGMRLLRVEIIGRRSGRDDIRPEVISIAGGDPESNGFSDAIAAGRKLLERLMPSARGKYLAGRVLFENPAIPHEGSSAGLAVAALFFSASQEYLEARNRYEIAPLVAFTGMVDATGSVLPVANAGLSEKVEASFYSWARVLVVPFSQFFAARSVVDRLEDAFPQRRLVVVGVKRVEDLLNDRRIMREINTPILTHSTAWAWRRKFSVGSVLITFALAIAVIALVVGPLDKNPVTVAPTGFGFELLNGAGRRVGIVRSSTHASLPSRVGNPHVALGDMDGDGVREVCWMEKADGAAVGENRAACRRAEGGPILFEVPFRFPGTYPDDPQIVSARFIPSIIQMGDIDGDGLAELIIGVNHSTMYPALVIAYDPRTGLELGRYVHTGGISTMRLWDLTGDGLPELIVTATNNAHDAAVLFVLDPRRLGGTSPTSANRAPARPDPGRELAYVRMSRGPIGRIASVPGGRGPGTLDINVADRQIILSVHEGDILTVGSDGIRRAAMLYYFDFGMRPVGVASNSDYDRLEAELVESGALEGPITVEERRALMDSLLWWDGETWRDSAFSRLPPPRD